MVLEVCFRITFEKKFEGVVLAIVQAYTIGLCRALDVAHLFRGLVGLVCRTRDSTQHSMVSVVLDVYDKALHGLYTHWNDASLGC